MPLHCFPSAQHATKTAVCSVSGHKSLYFLHFSNCRYSSPSRVFYEGTNSESHAPLGGGGTWGRDYVYHPHSHVVGYLCTKTVAFHIWQYSVRLYTYMECFTINTWHGMKLAIFPGLCAFLSLIPFITQHESQGKKHVP